MKARILIVAFLCAAPLAAHDFWIEPHAFEVAAGASVAITLRVGEGFVGRALTRPASSIAAFRALDPLGSRPIAPATAQVAGIVAARQAGHLSIGYESRPTATTLAAHRFERYLLEEGLERIIAERARTGESDAPARELFIRSAKSLIHVDEPKVATSLRPLDLPLELMIDVDPYDLRPGSKLEVALLYRGEPLAKALVVALAKNDPSRAQRLRTDEQGRASFDVDHSGAWLIKSVHMERAPHPAQGDWVSWWASLTFAIPES